VYAASASDSEASGAETLLIACATMTDLALPACVDGAVVMLGYDFGHSRVIWLWAAKYDLR
jgi:hypothetical protein